MNNWLTYNYEKYLPWRRSRALKSTDPDIDIKNKSASGIIESHIKVVTTVNGYDVVHLSRLIPNLLSTAERPHNVSFLICDNTNGKGPLLQKQSFANMTYYANDCSPYRGAMAHGISLNRSVAQIDSQYCLIIDPDCHVLINHWDTLCKEALQRHDAVAIGAPYPPLKLGKYHDYPGPHFQFFRPDIIRSLGPDWRPWSDRYLLQIFGLVGRNILRLGGFASVPRLKRNSRLRRFLQTLENKLGPVSWDPGWRVAKRVRNAGMNAITFRLAEIEDFDDFPDNQRDAYRTLTEEFELYMWKNCPIVTHLYSTKSGLGIWSKKVMSHEARTKKWLELIDVVRAEDG